MKKKVLSAFLLAAALVVSPIGGSFLSAVATASSNNAGSGASGKANFAAAAEAAIEEKIINAESGDVVELEGVTTLSNGTMKTLLEKGDVTLVLKYTYEDVDYVVTIPAGAALDNDIPWYGPLYLAAAFGNGAGNAASYTVKSGDTLSKIARANGLTLEQIAAKNPQISNVNVIKVGQKINVK